MSGRAEELEAFAREHGLTYAPDLPEEELDPGFFLFSLDQGQVVGSAEHCLEGIWESVRMRAFDFDLAEVSGLQALGVAAFWTDHTTATVAEVEIDPGVDLPYVYVDPKDLLTRLADDLDRIDRLHHDRLQVEYGVPEFDHVFEVRSPDHAFALALFDRGLIETMLAIGRGFVYEVRGSRFIVHAPQLAVDELPRLLTAASAFRRAIPALALEGRGAG